MDAWALDELVLARRLPEILSSSPAARLVLLDLIAGEALAEHEVHERAWVLVVSGEVELRGGEVTKHGGPGLLVELAPRERHSLRACTQSRVLLVLAPWPGSGHPGAMTLRDKLYARRRAAKRRART